MAEADKGKISWCCGQKSGIKIKEQNDNIAEDYIRKGEESLDVMIASPSEDWKVITAYYACYDCIYALLQKAGIKSEIHDCTIALMPLLEFNAEDIRFVTSLKDKRINVQYYNKKENLETESSIKAFIFKCKEKLLKDDFKKIRENIIRSIREAEKKRKG